MVCAVDGTRRILRKGSLVPSFFFVTVQVQVLAVLEPADFEDEREMARTAQKLVASRIAAWQGRESEVLA